MTITRLLPHMLVLPLAASPLGAQSMYSASPTADDIGFGNAVDVDGDLVYVAETQNFYRSGTIYVYGDDGGEWSELERIAPADAETPNGFGYSFDVDGNRLVASDFVGLTGRGVYIFERGSDGWRQAAMLHADDIAEDDGFGVDVAISGDYALVGAFAQNEMTGAAYLFRRDGSGNWSQVQKLSGDETGSRFGVVLALEGEHALIAATRADEGKGAVRAFRMEGDSLAPVDFLTAPGIGSNDRFGSAIELESRFAAIGVPRHNSGSGAVFTFEFDDEGGEWDFGTRLLPFAQVGGTQFGGDVAIAGYTIWAGALGASGARGAAYAIEWDQDQGWTSSTQHTVEDLRGGDRFGTTIAGEGDVVVVGVPGQHFSAGTAAIYTRSESGHWEMAARIMSDAEPLEPVTGGQVNCEDGTAGMFECDDVDMVAFIPLADLGASHGQRLNDVWGWTDPETGREFALVGRSDGTSFVDISDPSNPRYLGDLPMTPGSNPSVWRDVKVYDNHAFIVADGAGEHGMQVLDLTQLRDLTEPQSFEPTVLYDRIHSAHNIIINEETGYAYSVGGSGGEDTCGGGLHIIDIREPTQPQFVGCFADPETGRAGTGYSHDAQCIVYEGPDSDYRGHEICFGANETAISIADLTDKENPQPISRATYPSVGYAHQGWISEDHRYFFVDDELDEVSGGVENTRTMVFDITDLEDPVLAKEYFASTQSTDHNLYVRGNLLFQSNNTAGLRILDISDPTDPVEVGYFDTFPSGPDNAGFHGGSWSNYPFFRSGVILVTSRREGLFLLREKQELVP